jgi:hypothetical protein
MQSYPPPPKKKNVLLIYSCQTSKMYSMYCVLLNSQYDIFWDQNINDSTFRLQTQQCIHNFPILNLQRFVKVVRTHAVVGVRNFQILDFL